MSAADELKAVQIKANFVADKELTLLDISTGVQDGVACISGEVANPEQKALAEEIAYSIEGVCEVVNDISVVPDCLKTVLRCTLEEGAVVCKEIPAEDEADSLELELKASLGKLFHGIQISVSNFKIACVDGCVGSQEELVQLQRIVLCTQGVVGMDSCIEITTT